MIDISDLFRKGLCNMAKYIDENGCLVKVSSGISDGKAWMSCRVKPSGSRQRVKSKKLPERDTEKEAQEDLDRYVGERGWPLVEDTMI